MTLDRLTPIRWHWIPTVLLLFCLTALAAPAAEMKLEVQLVWGTNDGKSPDPKHKKVEAEILKKLQELPLKWTNYFEVNRQQMMLPASDTKVAPLSDKCKVEARNLGNGSIEVSLIGKGEHVARRTQALKKNEILVLGGNAPNATAWLVIIKRVE